MRYFVSSELGVANLLQVRANYPLCILVKSSTDRAPYAQRNFCWSSNSLWYDEIPHAHDPRRTTFFLGGKDAIVNAEVRPHSRQLRRLRVSLTAINSVCASTCAIMASARACGSIRMGSTARRWCRAAPSTTRSCVGSRTNRDHQQTTNDHSLFTPSQDLYPIHTYFNASVFAWSCIIASSLITFSSSHISSTVQSTRNNVHSRFRNIFATIPTQVHKMIIVRSGRELCGVAAPDT